MVGMRTMRTGWERGVRALDAQEQARVRESLEGYPMRKICVAELVD
jgi:hypothetical protein